MYSFADVPASWSACSPRIPLLFHPQQVHPHRVYYIVASTYDPVIGSTKKKGCDHDNEGTEATGTVRMWSGVSGNETRAVHGTVVRTNGRKDGSPVVVFEGAVAIRMMDGWID